MHKFPKIFANGNAIQKEKWNGMDFRGYQKCQ